MVTIGFLYHWKGDVGKVELDARKALEQKEVTDNVMLVLAREAWNIVMEWPQKGLFSEYPGQLPTHVPPIV